MIEYYWSPRGHGKTTYLASRVVDLQDEGYDPVVVLVADERMSDHWVKGLMEWEIDPSRIILFTPELVKNGRTRGMRYALAGADDIDRIPDYKDLLAELTIGALNDNVTLTHTNLP